MAPLRLCSTWRGTLFGQRRKEPCRRARCIAGQWIESYVHEMQKTPAFGRDCSPHLGPIQRMTQPTFGIVSDFA